MIIQKIAYKFTFYGYRRIYIVLRQMGYIVNHKKVYRIYRELNLQRIKKSKAKNNIISFNNNKSLSIAKNPNDIWSIDFAFDRIANGRMVKIMPIIDINSRFCIGIEIGFSITAEEVIKKLEECFILFGKPKIIRTDRGSEFKSREFERNERNNRKLQEFLQF